MALSPKTVRVSAALLLSAAFIFAGYYFSSPLQITIAGATSPDELLKDYAKKDTDADGLADWQESLYGTDSTNPHSVDAALLDGEAVAQGKVAPKFKSEAPAPEKVTGADIPGEAPGAGTLTDRFAKQFFENFMLSQHPGTTASEEDIAAFIGDAIQDLDAGVLHTDPYTMADVRVAGAGPEALSAYAISMATNVRVSAGGTTKDELQYLYDAIVKNDSAALKKVADIAAAYKALATGMRAIAVPQEAAAAHLEFMNIAMRMSYTIEDMAAFKTDPLRTFIGIKQYPAVGARLIRGAAAMDVIFKQQRVSFTQGEAGYPFTAILEQAAAALPSLPN